MILLNKVILPNRLEVILVVKNHMFPFDTLFEVILKLDDTSSIMHLSIKVSYNPENYLSCCWTLFSAKGGIRTGMKASTSCRF